MANISASSGVQFVEKLSEIIGRKKELDQIKQAIYESGTSLRVVLIRGPRGAEARKEPEGGYGKSRLLEEVARRTDPVDGEWRSLGDVAVSQPIDLIDIRLHVQSNFLREARNAFLGRADFANYYDAYERYQRRLSGESEYLYVREAAEKADRSFFIDYGKNAVARRMVWLLDTVEQLAVNSSDWLLKRGLLSSDDMKARTFEWLQQQIESDALPNTTLICAGRGREGQAFFDEIAAVTRQKHGKEAVVEVYAEPFTVEETCRYFAVLADDLRERVEVVPGQSSYYMRLVESLNELTNRESDRAKVVRLYTGGVPLRLALYAQLLVEGRTIPLQLQKPWPQVYDEIKTDDPLNPTPELELAQWQVEDHFINLLFNPRDMTDRRFRILQMLVRTRRGLTAEQLHFVLDNPERKNAKEWEQLFERRRILEIDEQLKQMATLFLVRPRAPWWQLWDEETGPVPGALRYGLQDEIYRIYAEHMSLNDKSGDNRLQRIWDGLFVKETEEQERYKENRDAEKKARDRLYTQLRDWAKYKQERLQAQRRKYQEDDERSLRAVSLTEVSRVRFPLPSDSLRLRRIAVIEAERELELEYMHYALLLHPERGFNTDYTDLANEWYKANVEAVEYLAQAVMWRVLTDEDSLRFVDFEWRDPIKTRRETPLQVLKRAAQQEDVSRWIKRFTLRKNYDRAVEFAKSVELAVDQLKEGSEQDRKDWSSWKHTFAYGDRRCWQMYAQIMRGEETDEAIKDLKQLVKDLEKLAKTTVLAPALDKQQTKSGQIENGFKGADAEHPDHPALVSLQRVISYIYNTLGYAYVNLGKLRESVDAYGKALYYIRETGALFHRANVLNNLSRALSDMGRERAVRVCQDGLELRRMLGADVPIAYSQNTLALILNDRNRPEEAWPEAAKAVAYFRRAEEPRGLGLALLQLGEALRRMVGPARHGRVLPVDPDSIYSAAHDALEEAHSLFLPADPDLPDYATRVNLKEPMRLIEAKIEWGCLFRDRIQAREGVELSSEQRLRYREAVTHLETAAKLAVEKGFGRHEIDAKVNLAWTHYYAGNLKEAESEVRGVVQTLEDRNGQYFIRPKSNQHPQGIVPNPQDPERPLGEYFIFSQLSKIYNLRGLMALSKFKERVKYFKQECPEDHELRRKRVHEDPSAKKCLEQVAECYTQATAYAQLYSPRSSALSMIYDRLYDFLNKFNGQELDDFHFDIAQQRECYPLDKIKQNIEDLGDIDKFIQEAFGLSRNVSGPGGADGN
jgi:tetratricopeptide (TPR) repeat protein